VAFAQNEGEGPNRGGFTLLLNLGVGVQHDAAFEKSEAGLAGLNLGVGGFLTDHAALMFRVSGTNVTYTLQTPGLQGQVSQVSGVAGVTLQYWLNDAWNIEAGPGLGFWDTGGLSEEALGLVVGTGLTIFNRGKHNLQVGVEYAPAFTDSGTVNNVGITFGYQFL
jgi:hypothetical protein